MKKRLCLLFCLILVLSVFPVSASAAGAIDDNEPLSLTVQYWYAASSDSIVKISEAQFDLYLVASLDASGKKFTLTPEFAPYAATVTNLSKLGELKSTQLRILANNLKTVVQSGSFPKYDSGYTDGEGQLLLPSEDTTLERGMYLIVGHDKLQDGYTYTPVPTLITLPKIDEVSGEWIYDVTAEPKLSRTKYGDTPITITVTKVWEDGNGSLRPVEIIAHLYKNGVEYDTVTLNAANSWTYTWNNLNAQEDWSVSEEPVAGYTCSVERTGNVFVITNTGSGTPSPSPTPTVSFPPFNYPTPSPYVPYGSPTPVPTTPPKLPQTGVLWWPVPVLIVLGLFFIVIGCELRRKKQ